MVGHAFTHSIGWVRGTLSTRSRQSTGTGAWWAIVVRQRGYGWDFIAPYMPHMSGPMKFSFLFFLFWFSCSDFRFLPWWKTMDGPWFTIWWDVWAYCSAFPCIVSDLKRTQGSSGRSLGRFQINYPRSSAYDTSPCGTSSLETRVVLCPQLDVRWNFLVTIHRGLFPSKIPSGDQLLNYVLIVAQDWDSICATEDALFGTSVRIVWYWLSFNAQKGQVGTSI